jgi:hypothetical protein
MAGQKEKARENKGAGKKMRARKKKTTDQVN